ncbi:hypothetical protein ACFO0N_21965 [Halobium salinum]|uniref:Carboxymuconolactone decarboxylase family protein n=1 Tax=Halobium salinum TaxID=1364940 RepID=A0ABD5PIM0_9EURY
MTTAVNECQYCVRFHTERASEVGVVGKSRT